MGREIRIQAQKYPVYFYIWIVQYSAKVIAWEYEVTDTYCSVLLGGAWVIATGVLSAYCRLLYFMQVVRWRRGTCYHEGHVITSSISMQSCGGGASAGRNDKCVAIDSFNPIKCDKLHHVLVAGWHLLPALLPWLKAHVCVFVDSKKRRKKRLFSQVFTLCFLYSIPLIYCNTRLYNCKLGKPEAYSA